MFPELVFQTLQATFDQAFQLTLQDPKQMQPFHAMNPLLDIKEAAILALGSIAEVEACVGQMEAFISPLLDFLLKEMNSESLLIRSTSLWVVSKFAAWISTNLTDEQFIQLLGFMTQKLRETD